jgi:hypothetical protein
VADQIAKIPNVLNGVQLNQASFVPESEWSISWIEGDATTIKEDVVILWVVQVFNGSDVVDL